ncbi:uncharacterized protein [Macrobrachium rosenbergii]|uniref:uncharacterized protein n=1 Tax=Macrobrachium rosenbergii TaxID=79674 RepID=UPI0034D598B1
MEQGHYDNLMEELLTQAPDLYRNFICIDRGLFNETVERVTPYIQKKVTFWRKLIEPGLRVAITLRFFATGDSYKSLQYSFWVAHNTISYIVPETCRAIVAAFRDEELQVPQTPVAWQEVARGFEEWWNFPHIIGSIDGKHIRLRNLPKMVRITSTTRSSSPWYYLQLLMLHTSSYTSTWVPLGQSQTVVYLPRPDWLKCCSKRK